MYLLFIFLIVVTSSLVNAGPRPRIYPIKDELLEPINLMGPKGPAHYKSEAVQDSLNKDGPESFLPFDFSRIDAYARQVRGDPDTPMAEHNRVKRKAKHHHHTRGGGGGGHRKAGNEPEVINDDKAANPEFRAADQTTEGKKKKKKKKHRKHKKAKIDYGLEPPRPSYEQEDPISMKPMPRSGEIEPDDGMWWTDPNKSNKKYVEMPKDLYQAHLRPGVIFRIHMSEAILKMQYRQYNEDRDESVIEADTEYLRLTRKVINDEITKFEDLRWLTAWFNNRSQLIKEHQCNQHYFTVGTPPTRFTHSEEYMKRACLFDSVYLDHIPYVIGDDSSLMAAVAPPVLHCDAGTCTSVPFVDSIMFSERLPRTNVRTLTRCQAMCRGKCRNDADCLKRCSDRCLRS